MLAVVACWSTAGLCVRSMQEASAFEINAGRSVAMSLCLLAVLLAQSRRAGAERRLRAMWPGPLLAVTFFYVVGSTLFIQALSSTSIANAMFIGSTSPVFAALAGALLLRERQAWRSWAAAVLALAGVYLMVGTGGRIEMGFGDLAAVGVAMAFAGQIVSMRRYSALNPWPAAVVAGLVTAALNLGLAGGFSVTGRDLLLMLFMGCVQLAVPFLLIAKSARHLPAMHMTLLSLLDAVAQPLLVWLLLAEALRQGQLLGGALVLAGVLIAASEGARQLQPAPLPAAART